MEEDLSEEYFYKQGQISVTKTLIRYGDSSFATANVDCVSIGEQNTQTYWIIAIVLFLVAAVSAITVGVEIYSHTGDGSNETIASILSLFIGCIFVYLATHPKYYFRFRSCSGESRVLVSRDYAIVGILKRAIQQAIIARG